MVLFRIYDDCSEYMMTAGFFMWTDITTFR